MAYHAPAMPRSSKRSADAARSAATARFVRQELWNGFVKGEAVRIAGIRGGHWRFRCHVENVQAGTSWIEVDELDVPRGVQLPSTAPDGYHRTDEEEVRQPPVRRVRAFSEERVLLIRPGRRRRRSAEPELGASEATARGSVAVDVVSDGREAAGVAEPEPEPKALPVPVQLSLAMLLDGVEA